MTGPDERALRHDLSTLERAQPHPLVVVGAGPVGLTAALAARSDGIPAVVVEAESADRTRPGSRATYVFRESLDLLETISPGISQPLIELSGSWTAIRCTYDGREVYFHEFPPSAPGRFGVSLSQKELERVLIGRCHEAGIPFLWDRAVEAVTAGRDGVEIRCSTGDTLLASYVIGADGGRSQVRASIGATFDGDRSDTGFIIVDVAEDETTPMPKVRTFNYRHPAVGGRNVLLVPFGNGWRLDLQLRPGDDVDEWQRPPRLSQWITAVAGAKYAQRIQWVSTYRFNRSVATRFTDEHARVLIAGEAAHLFPPFGGGRGLNSGIPDAIFSAHAVKAALAAPTQPLADAAIRHVAHERRAAGLANRDAASLALERMEARTPRLRAQQWLAAALAPRAPRFGNWLDRGPMGPTDPVAANSRF
jgi:3-(3-hydroxy-phenyl)propionate hydroxylase